MADETKYDEFGIPIKQQASVEVDEFGIPLKKNESISGSKEVSSKDGERPSVPSQGSGTRDNVPTTYQWSGGDVGMQQKVITPTNADSKSAVNVVTKEMTAEGRLAEEKEGYELSNKKSLAEQEASKSFSIATENYTYDQVKNLVQLQSLLNKTIEDSKDPKLAKQTQDVEVIKKQIENLRNQQVTPKYTLNAEGQTVSYIKPKYKNVGEMYDETIMFQNKHQKLIGEIENYETKLNPIIEKARKNAQYTPNKKDEYGNTYYDLNPMEAFLNGAENSLETTAIGLANMFGFDDEAKSAAQMKWYKDNVISPKKADGLVSQGFEMLGGVAPLVAGGSLAQGSVLGSVIINSLLFGAQDYGGTWYNSYASKKAEGMSDEEASKEANSNARFAGVKGMILGGTMPLQSMAGNAVGTKLFVTQAEKNSFRSFLYGQIGMLPAFGSSTALQNWYEGKPITDNVGRAMVDAFIIGGMTHALAALPKLPAKAVRLFEHTIAKNYNKVSPVIDAAVQDGTISPTVGDNIVAKAKAYDKIKGAGINEDVEVEATELQVQIDKLEASKKDASPAVIGEIDRQINELSTKLKVEAGFPLTPDERKELNLLQTARDSNKEYDKAKLAELEQRQKNNQDGKTKIVTDQPIRVKYKDGRTGLVFVNAEGDVEFVPDGNSAGLVIDKQAGASFRSLANLGFEQVVGETIAEPNSQLLSGDISLGTSVLYKGGKYQIASSKNAPDGVKLDTDGKVRVVYLKGEDGKVIAVGADSADGKRIIDDANRVIGKGEVKPTETAPVQEKTKVIEAQQPNAETVEVELEPTVTEPQVEQVTEVVEQPVAEAGQEGTTEPTQEVVEQTTTVEPRVVDVSGLPKTTVKKQGENYIVSNEDGEEVGYITDVKIRGDKVSLYPEINEKKGLGQSAYIAMAKIFPSKNIVSGDMSPKAEKMWEALHKKGLASKKNIGTFDNGEPMYQYELKKHPEIVELLEQSLKETPKTETKVEETVAEPLKDVESTATKIEKRETIMPDGEDGVELYIKNEDGTEKSIGKFYPEDTKEMAKIERGYKLADQQKSKIKEAKDEFDQALQDLKDATDLTKLGAVVDPEKQAEAMFKVHKALVKLAKAYLAKGLTDVKKFAREAGVSAKSVMKAWDEANGGKQYKADELDYDMDEIVKTAIRRGIKVREKLQAYKAKQKDIAQAIKAFMDDTEIKGALTPTQVKALVKRAANITTDKQFDKFIDYADKVIKDANFAEDVSNLKSNQKGALKKRHNEKTADVRKFLEQEIFDEDGNLLLDEITFSEYADAVSALNQKIPDHKLMEAKDASGKTLAERVAEQSQQSNQYMNINSVQELMKAWTALDNNIVDIDSYKSFTRNINKIKSRLKELLDSKTITQDDYDNAIAQIYKHEDGKRVYETKYATQIGQLKDAQIADAQAKVRLVDDSGFNKIQKELWQEFKRNMSVNFDKIKNLEVADLDKLNTVLDRMEGGFMPEYEFRQIMNKIETQGQGARVAKQVARISDKVKSNLDKLRDIFLSNDPARYEAELGIAHDSSLWKYVLGRTQKALKKYTEATHDMYESWYDNLPAYYKITGKKPIIIDKVDPKKGKSGKKVVTQREYDMVKVGTVRHMINHAAEMKAKGKEAIDFFGEQLQDIAQTQKYNIDNQLSILSDVYNKLKSDASLLNAEGNIDYNKVWESVENNDGKVLDVNQSKIEKNFDTLDSETGDMITSSNAIRGVNATKNPKHIRRYSLGVRVGEGQLNTSDQVGVRAGSSYERTNKDVPDGALELNIEKVIQRQIKEAAKDYHLNQELSKLDGVFDDAKLAANREDINVIKEIQQDQRNIMQYHISSGNISPIWNKIQGGLYVKMLTTPYRLVAEAVSNTTQMFLRGKSLKGLLTSVPSQTINPFFKEMTDLMKATDSTSLDHAEFRSMKNIETKDGQITREGLIKRGVDNINGVTNAMAVGGMWMPNFSREFQALTGESYNKSKHLNNPSYIDAMREAAAYADRETETVIGSTLKGGARREIEILPFAKRLKADGTGGSLAKFLSNYPYRDTKELTRGIEQMATGVNEGRIDGAARAAGVITNMMLYTGTYAIAKAVWKKNFGNDEEKEDAEETIKRLTTTEGMLEFTKQEALSNAVNTLGTKYSQAGKLVTRLSVLSLYNSDMLNDEQKNNLKQFAEAQLYLYLKPIRSNKDRKNAVGEQFISIIPQLKEVIDVTQKEIGGEEGMVAFFKEVDDVVREKGIDGLSKDQKAKLSLIKNMVNTINITLMVSQGTQLPFSRDFVKNLDNQIKSLEN